MRAQAATDKGKSGGPLRAMMDVVSTEGVSGLYRGLNSTLFTLFFANFIYFYAFHLMRAFVGRNKRIRKLGKVIGPPGLPGGSTSNSLHARVFFETAG